LAIIIVIGTTGYWFIGDRQYSPVDTFYMTIITVTTIGFGEIIDLSGNPLGRLFTVGIAISGIGVLAYVATNLTALVVEGELSESFRRRKMERLAQNSREHYIICGLGSVGWHIVDELRATKRPHVIIDTSKKNVERTMEAFRDVVFLEGDATDNDILLKAGIKQARGLFAVTDDDNQNLVICLTAKQLNPGIRVVIRCNELQNSEKMSRVGADAVVSPSYIGGLRMASEMVRPTVVSFLDTMLRDSEKNLRVEEIAVSEPFVGKTVATLNLKRHHHTLLLAVKLKDTWVYNPSENHVIEPDSVLVVMTSLEDRQQLEKYLHPPG
jgi:voltage-gated potassium channel